MSNRRHQYRTSGPREYPLDVQVRTHGDTVAAHLVDLSGWGARVRFPPGRDPKLAEDRRVVLQFMQPENNLFMGTAAAVRNRAEEDDGVYYGFEFVDIARLHRFVPDELRPFFNRRRSYRVRPDRAAPVEVVLGFADRSVGAGLVDLSSDGLALLAPPETLRALETAERLTVALQLPEPLVRVALAVRVVYCGAKGHGNRAGLAFLGRRGGPSQHARDRVQEYVMARQRESLMRKGS